MVIASNDWGIFLAINMDAQISLYYVFKVYGKNWMKTKLWISKYSERKIVIFLSTIPNICFVCSKELAHWTDSFEYPQYMYALVEE